MASFTLPWATEREISPASRHQCDHLNEDTQYVTFLAPVNASSVIDTTHDIQDEISHLNCVNISPDSNLHITLKHTEVMTSDISESWIEDIAETAEEVFDGMDEIDLTLSRPDLFPSAVFADVKTGRARLELINKRLTQHTDLPRSEYDYPNYWPHMTLAKINGQDEFQTLINTITRLRETTFGPTTISEIKLIVDDSCRDDFPDFNTVRMFSLSDS